MCRLKLLDSALVLIGLLQHYLEQFHFSFKLLNLAISFPHLLEPELFFRPVHRHSLQRSLVFFLLNQLLPQDLVVRSRLR